MIPAENIREAREALRLTQNELGAALGVSRRVVMRWENEGAEVLVGWAIGGFLVSRGRLAEASRILWSNADLFGEARVRARMEAARARRRRERERWEAGDDDDGEAVA